MSYIAFHFKSAQQKQPKHKCNSNDILQELAGI